MKRVLFPLIGIVVAFFVMTIGGVDNVVRGQPSPLPAPTNIRAADGGAGGEVVVSWDVVSDAAFYRVGWMAAEDYAALPPQEHWPDPLFWLESFHFVDIGNRGQNFHTVARLTPGISYYFIAASNDNRYGTPSWPLSGSDWAQLTLAGDGPSCPGTGTQPGTCPSIESSRFRMSETKYKAIDAGKNHSCGIKQDDTVECWGDNAEGQSDAPAGKFEHVSAGGVATCAIDTDDELVCWGHPRLQRAPSGKYTEVSVGDEHACAITVPVKNNNQRDENRVNCWGLSNNDGRIANQPENGWLWIDVGAGSDYNCGLYTYQSSTNLNCWGNDAHNYTRISNSFPHYTKRNLAEISAGQNHLCGLADFGLAECSGNDIHGQTTGVPSAEEEGSSDDFYTYDAINAGGGHSCALRTTGQIRCWGDDLRGQATPPGNNDELNVDLQGVGDFKAVSAGGSHTCGLRDDGTAVCWGYNVLGQADPP